MMGQDMAYLWALDGPSFNMSTQTRKDGVSHNKGHFSLLSPCTPPPFHCSRSRHVLVACEGICQGHTGASKRLFQAGDILKGESSKTAG